MEFKPKEKERSPKESNDKAGIVAAGCRRPDGQGWGSLPPGCSPHKSCFRFKDVPGYQSYDQEG